MPSSVCPCGKPLAQSGAKGGRPRRYCGDACRQRCCRARRQPVIKQELTVKAPVRRSLQVEPSELAVLRQDFRDLPAPVAGDKTYEAPLSRPRRVCMKEGCGEETSGPALCPAHQKDALRWIRETPVDISTGPEVAGRGGPLRFEPGYVEKRPAPEAE